MNANITRRLDVLACACCAACALLLALLGIDSPLLRTLLGAPLALIAPGYALIATLFPRSTSASGAHLRFSTRLMFSLGMSVALLVISGIALNFTPPGIQYWSLTTVLALLTIAFSVLAGYRLGNISADSALPLPQRLSARGFGPLQSGLIALAAIVAAGAVTYAIQESYRARRASVLHLWMLPVESAPPNTLRIGARNISAAASMYRIDLVRAGYTIQQWSNLPLAQGQTWEITTTMPLDAPGEGPLIAALYEQGISEPVRRVQYWPR